MHELARLLLVGVLAIFAVSLAFMAVARPPVPERVAQYRGVIRFLGRWMYWWSAPLVRWLDTHRFNANHVTWLGFLLTAGAAALAAQGWWGLAGVSLMLGGLCDILDGELARQQNAVTDSGAFLDSTLDRLSEIVLFGGIAAGFSARSGAYWAYAAVGASMMVSYARARGEGLGVTCPPGGFERPHRVLVLMFALLLCTLFPERWAAPATEVACAIIAMGATATATARMTTIYGVLRRRDASPPVTGVTPAEKSARSGVR